MGRKTSRYDLSKRKGYAVLKSDKRKRKREERKRLEREKIEKEKDDFIFATTKALSGEEDK